MIIDSNRSSFVRTANFNDKGDFLCFKHLKVYVFSLQKNLKKNYTTVEFEIKRYEKENKMT